MPLRSSFLCDFSHHSFSHTHPMWQAMNATGRSFQSRTVLCSWRKSGKKEVTSTKSWKITRNFSRVLWFSYFSHHSLSLRSCWSKDAKGKTTCTKSIRGLSAGVPQINLVQLLFFFFAAPVRWLMADGAAHLIVSFCVVFFKSSDSAGAEKNHTTLNGLLIYLDALKTH